MRSVRHASPARIRQQHTTRHVARVDNLKIETLLELDHSPVQWHAGARAKFFIYHRDPYQGPDPDNDNDPDPDRDHDHDPDPDRDRDHDLDPDRDHDHDPDHDRLTM